MKASMEDVINLHIECDSKSINIKNKFITGNEGVKSEYRKYLEKKYAKYKKEFDILNDFLLINPKIEINKCIVNSESLLQDHNPYIILNINDNVNVKINYDLGTIKIKLENIKNFEIFVYDYNLKEKSKSPELIVVNNNKVNFELEDIITYFFNKRIEADLKNNLKNFFIKIEKIKNCIKKESDSHNMNYILDKDLLNMKSEDIEFSMLANDYQVKPFLDKIQNIASNNSVITKKSKKSTY